MSDQYKGNLTPELSNKTTQLEPASVGVKLKKLLAMVGVGLFIGGGFYIGYILSDATWAMKTAYWIAGGITVVGAFVSLTAKVGKCPYCEHELGKGTLDHISGLDENEQIECTNCHEWLISSSGEIRAFNMDDAEKKKKFDGPAFQSTNWPAECIVCGDNVSHYGKAKSTKLNAEQLLVGTLSVSSGAVDNIPYCELHKDTVDLKIKEDYLRLVFPDFSMMRRYISKNKEAGQKVVKIK